MAVACDSAVACRRALRRSTASWAHFVPLPAAALLSASVIAVTSGSVAYGIARAATSGGDLQAGKSLLAHRNELDPSMALYRRTAASLEMATGNDAWRRKTFPSRLPCSLQTKPRGESLRCRNSHTIPMAPIKSAMRAANLRPRSIQDQEVLAIAAIGVGELGSRSRRVDASRDLVSVGHGQAVTGATSPRPPSSTRAQRFKKRLSEPPQNEQLTRSRLRGPEGLTGFGHADGRGPFGPLETSAALRLALLCQTGEATQTLEAAIQRESIQRSYWFVRILTANLVGTPSAATREAARLFGL